MAFGDATYDGDSLFDSGPHVVNPQGIARGEKLVGFAGLDGAAALDMGKRPRIILGRGVLKAATFAAMRDGSTGLLDLIEAKQDGSSHTLVDTHGTTHENCKLMDFRPGPIYPISDTEFCCEWIAVWRKMGG